MLNEVQDDGHTYRKHLQNAARRGHESARKRLEGPGVPRALEYLLAWHTELQFGRQYGDMGFPQAMTWADLNGWASLTGRELTRWESLALMQMDLATRAPAKD